MLENIKLLLGISDDTKDALLRLLIQQAEDEAKDFTHRDDVCCLSSTIERMVVYNYNRLGTEGLNSESYSGLSYSYSADYPEQIIKILKKHRKLVTL
jgi:hypothetical protein